MDKKDLLEQMILENLTKESFEDRWKQCMEHNRKTLRRNKLLQQIDQLKHDILEEIQLTEREVYDKLNNNKED